MLESAIAAFLAGGCVGVIATTLIFRHMHRTRREIVRVNEQTLNRVALREAFFQAACSCPNPHTFLASCVVHGVRERKLRVIRP